MHVDVFTHMYGTEKIRYNTKSVIAPNYGILNLLKSRLVLRKCVKSFIFLETDSLRANWMVVGNNIIFLLLYIIKCIILLNVIVKANPYFCSK